MSRWRRYSGEIREAMPLVVALGRLDRGSRGTRLLLAVIAVYAVIALCVPIAEPLQRRLLAAYHFRPTSTASWVALQPLPKMYGFGNRVWFGSTPTAHLFERHALWVNHYPARYARFDGGRRATFPEPNASREVWIRSRYRRLTRWTAYEVRFDGRSLRMIPIEVPDE